MKGAIFGIAAAFVAAFTVLATNIGVAESADTAVIKERIEFMKKSVLGNFKVISAYAKDGKGTLAEVEKAAKGLQEASGKIPALFPKGTGRPDVDEKTTRALSKIWEDWASFEKAAKATGEHAGHVAMYAAQGNAEEVKKHAGLIGKEGCGACHKAFRGEAVK